MVRSVSCALAHIKCCPIARIGGAQLIETLCEQINYRWRSCLLDPVNTVQLFILQVLAGNTAITHLRHLSDRAVAASSYCEARMRLPLKLLRLLLAHVAASAQHGAGCVSSSSWLGHRVLVTDMSTCTLPDTPALQEHFGQPRGQKSGCGFPVAKLLGLMDLASGMFVQMLMLPLYVHERNVIALHPMLRAGADVLLGDRGFCSFVHLALLQLRQVHAVFKQPRHRGTDRPYGKVRLVRTLGCHDRLVLWLKPKICPKWMNVAQWRTLPPSLLLREVQYVINARGRRTTTTTIITTLLDPMLYPRQELARLYQRRWQIETNLRHLKTTLKMDLLKCKTVQGVMKELAVYLLVYNLVRAVMLQAAQRQQAHADRISFIDAARWLLASRAQQPLTLLVVNPPRPDRCEPRVLKRRIKEYDLMTTPRRVLRQRLLTPKLEP